VSDVGRPQTAMAQYQPGLVIAESQWTALVYWGLAFGLACLLLFLAIYPLFVLTDLESDMINPTDACVKLNKLAKIDWVVQVCAPLRFCCARAHINPLTHVLVDKRQPVGCCWLTARVVIFLAAVGRTAASDGWGAHCEPECRILARLSSPCTECGVFGMALHPNAGQHQPVQARPCAAVR
jgi:hypothetical protein